MSNQARFSIIPGWVVTDPRLKPRDLQVLCLLGRHTDRQGWCRRSQVKMAGELSCARSTVQAAIDRLADIGVVEKHVVESKSGADQAHYFRVIFDRMPPSGYAFDAWEDEESEEDNPIVDASDGHPPADISAPPADPEPAPPAGSEPAPINDPQLTPPNERIERERGREGSDGNENREHGESRSTVLRAFNIWYASWPEKRSIPKTAEEAWFELSREERAECIDRTPDYIERFGKTKITTYAAVYLRDRMWKRLPPKAPTGAGAELVAPFGKAGMAYRFWIMNLPERQHPSPPPMVLRWIDEGGPRADDEIIKRRAAYSWPRLVELNRRIDEREPIRVTAGVAALGADFVSTELSGAVGQAWKRLFRKLRLPWLPVEPRSTSDGKSYAWLPPIHAAGGGDEDLDRAVAAAWWQFAERCRGHADAA